VPFYGLMPSVSVIIPTYNRACLLERAVRSVMEQTFHDLELIVVDDGSTDATYHLLENVRPSAIYLRHDKNLGVSAARNTGIRAASGRLIAFLDSDDQWLPEKLSTQIKFFEDNPSAMICQCQEFWHRNGRRVNPRVKHLKPSGFIFEKSLALCLVSPSAVMIRKELFDKVGLFDETLPVCEDYDLWLRVAVSHPVYLIDEHLLIRHAGHGDQLSSSIFGMDRFRIRAILNLLRDSPLKEEQRLSALAELKKKCLVYGRGCLKRRRKKEGEFYLGIHDRIMGDKKTAAVSLILEETAAMAFR